MEEEGGATSRSAGEEQPPLSVLLSLVSVVGGVCEHCFFFLPRMQRERAELEQNFAREIGNLVQRLSAEKEQLEAELKLKMDQEVMLVRWVMMSQLRLCLMLLF